MTTVDRILDVIDAGLQTPVPDPTFGEVSPTVHDHCVRCQYRQPAEASDFCATCRAVLLGDEPVAGRAELTEEQIEAVLSGMRHIAEGLAAAFSEVADVVAGALSGMAEAFATVEPLLPADAWDALRTPAADPVQRARARRARPEVCPRHGSAPGGLCRRCAR